MKALVFDIRINSLYSIRIPFTWQSALTYPIMPPSAVIGMIANALQRHKNDKNPLDYLDLLEEKILWAGSRLLTPCVIKSYTTSAVVKWEDKLGGKFTNALGRQYAYSKEMQIAAIFKDEENINDVAIALKSTPLTCGDSESPISLVNGVKIEDANNPTKELKGSSIETFYPVPFTKDTILESDGQIYLMHERCRKKKDNFPLVSYIVPIREEKRIFKPSMLKIRVSNENVFEIKNIGYIITGPLQSG